MEGFGNLLKSLLGKISLRPNQPVQAAQPKMNMGEAVRQMQQHGWQVEPNPGERISTVSATPTQPVSTPQPQMPVTPQNIGPSSQADGFVFDYNQLPRDQFYAQNGKRAGFQPAQPPRAFGELLRQFFPNEATAAAAVAASENATFDPTRPDNINWDGTPDRGQWQINQNTFNGLMQRRGSEMANYGITNFNDARDPRKATQMAKMIKDEGSWNRWYGPQDTGFNLNGGYFSPGTERAYYAENVKGGMNKPQALDKARSQVEADRKKKRGY